MRQVVIYDTTLRDGAQGEGISFSVADKLEVVGLLDDLGVDYIEGGWPGSNAKDLAFFSELKSFPLRHSRVVAFTSTRRKGQKIEQDEHMQTVLNTGLRHCAVVGKTWDYHVEVALRTDLEENLRMIGETIAFLKDRGIEAIFDAEHFFDGYKHNPAYALKCLEIATNAGADWLVLCDTNGGSLPNEISTVIQEIRQQGFVNLGIHAHNDGGLAVANSLAAVDAGAVQVQGTMNGFGERCGNTDLCTFVPNVVLKHPSQCHLQSVDLPKLRLISDRLYSMVGKIPVSSQPFVGQSAFAHKAGIHVSAVLRDPALYEHIDPAVVGNSRRVLVSELSGESNVVYTLQQLGLSAPKEMVTQILKRIKSAELDGVVFEGAETSLELLILVELGRVQSSSLMSVASAEDDGNGWKVKLVLDRDGIVSEVSGVGDSVAAALAFAIFQGQPFRLLEQRTTEVPTLYGTTKYRAVVKSAWKGRELATTAVADTTAMALAESLYQVFKYVDSSDEATQKSGAVAR